MKPGDQQQPPTLAEVVRRAADVVDPEAANDGVADLVLRFEDRDEPISQVQEAVEQEVAEAVGAVDPDEIDPAVQMAGAVVTYLAFRRDAVDEDREDVLRLAARAEYDGTPPEAILEWLDAEGVAV
jgi:ABC-type sugar transport system substrate-binding protein